MGLFKSIKNFFFSEKKEKEETQPDKSGIEIDKSRNKRKITPNIIQEGYMEDQSRDHHEEYNEGYRSFMSGREMMSPELIKSFNEFSQLLHNMNIKMATQNDQNMALLKSLETIPAIIKDIPRARELEGDILQEILINLKDTRNDKLKMADRLSEVKTAMMAMEENSKAQISFFDGKERGHRDQMNMMRDFIEREKKHHRNNLTGVIFIVILFVGILCTGAFFFIRERFNSLENSFKSGYSTNRMVPRQGRPYSGIQRESGSTQMNGVNQGEEKSGKHVEEGHTPIKEEIKKIRNAKSAKTSDDSSSDTEEQASTTEEVPFE